MSEFNCPECGRECPNARGLGVHRHFSHGVQSPANLTRGHGRPKHYKKRAAEIPAAVGTTRRVVPSVPSSGRAGGSPLPQFTLDEAVELLAAVIAQRVTAAIESRIDSVVAAKVAASAVKLAATTPNPAGVKPATTRLAELDSDLLRIKAGVAKKRGDMTTWSECTNILERRERAAASIERESKEAEA